MIGRCDVSLTQMLTVFGTGTIGWLDSVRRNAGAELFRGVLRYLSRW